MIDVRKFNGCIWPPPLLSYIKFAKVESIYHDQTDNLCSGDLIGGWLLLIYGRVKKFGTMAWWCKKEERRVGLAVLGRPSLFVLNFMAHPWINRSQPPIDWPKRQKTVDNMQVETLSLPFPLPWFWEESEDECLVLHGINQSWRFRSFVWREQ